MIQFSWLAPALCDLALTTILKLCIVCFGTTTGWTEAKSSIFTPPQHNCNFVLYALVSQHALLMPNVVLITPLQHNFNFGLYALVPQHSVLKGNLEFRTPSQHILNLGLKCPHSAAELIKHH